MHDDLLGTDSCIKLTSQLALGWAEAALKENFNNRTSGIGNLRSTEGL